MPAFDAGEGVMGTRTAAHDPSVAVRRRHLPFVESTKGRKFESACLDSALAGDHASLSSGTSIQRFSATLL